MLGSPTMRRPTALDRGPLGANPCSGGTNVAKRTCSVEGCERPHMARGWCHMHYARWKNGGDLSDPAPKVIRGDMLARFDAQIDLSIPNGCWLWTNELNRGYGHTTDADGRYRGAHRVVYETLVEPIPEGLTLDHLCHNEAAARGECRGGEQCPHRACVNPDHLEPVPDGINIRRSPLTRASLNAAATHCPHGHEYTEENTMQNERGWRWCRACDRARPNRVKKKNR